MPAIYADDAVVSVNVHSSVESMEKALAWQETDATWQAQFAKMEAACGSADDLSVNVLKMQKMQCGNKNPAFAGFFMNR